MQQGRLTAIVLSTAACALTLFCTAAPRRADARPAPPVRTPQCTIDIASGTPSACSLAKSKDEWILWSNPSPGLRSVHFKPDANPFTEQSCWDVAAGARGRSGPIALSAALKTYAAYTSNTPCSANPASDASGGTITVTIQ